MRTACSVRVRGMVQGVGFRPFVFRLARAHTLGGWVMNGDDGVEIHVEGADDAMATFLRDLRDQLPPAATIATIDVSGDEPAGLRDFTIRESPLPAADRPYRARPRRRAACLDELFDPATRVSGIPTSIARTAGRALR